MDATSSTLRRFRCVLILFIVALIVSGVTAFPLQYELDHIVLLRGLNHVRDGYVLTGFDRWILTVRDGLRQSYAAYPWLAYGTDWLAFAHIVIAIFFFGALIDPVRNIWTLQAGVIACILVIPLALICGPLRHIPFGWRIIDCSFGVFGAIPLLYCLKLARVLNRQRPNKSLQPTATTRGS